MAEESLENIPCQLLPYKVEDIFSAMDDSQKMGWQITSYNLPDIWKYSQGENVTIAVLDSGCDLTHPDLKDNLIPGKNFVEPDLPPSDEAGHGTHVASIIAALNNESGIVGVAPKAKIMPVKVLNSMGAGNMQNVLDGINWAADNGADFICMSLGTRNPVAKVEEAIINASKKGVVCFVAAGNAGSSRQLLYPAAYSSVISVGAVDENNLRADFSCTGPNLDFVAPGTKIYGAFPKSSYAYLSGTSQSTPFVVGVAALLLSVKRHQDTKLKMTIDEVRENLKENALDVKNLTENLDAAGKKFWQGFGIINPSSFNEWVDLKTIDSIKTDTIKLSEKMDMVKDKSLFFKIKAELQVLCKKIPD